MQGASYGKKIQNKYGGHKNVNLETRPEIIRDSVQRSISPYKSVAESTKAGNESFGFNDCFAHEQQRYLSRLQRSQDSQENGYGKHMKEVAGPKIMHEIKESEKQDAAILAQQ